MDIQAIVLLFDTLASMARLASMNIALVAKKGGVGKRTVSLLLHESLRSAGRDVRIRDWDLQGTSTKALSIFSPATLASMATLASVTIMDTPPSLEHPATRSALEVADLILIPTSPSPADLWEAADAARFAQQTAPSKQIRLLFNRIRKGTVLSRIITDSATDICVQPLGKSLTQRECYQRLLAQGWKGLDGPAREEVLQLTVEVLGLLTGTKDIQTGHSVHTGQTVQSRQSLQ